MNAGGGVNGAEHKQQWTRLLHGGDGTKIPGGGGIVTEYAGDINNLRGFCVHRGGTFATAIGTRSLINALGINYIIQVSEMREMPTPNMMCDLPVSLSS